jgi:tRNA C32,U32 (ribose-2'-O)-methylase TrmJ
MYRIRRIFSRSPLEPEEVAILRGVCSKILTSQSARTNDPAS